MKCILIVLLVICNGYFLSANEITVLPQSSVFLDTEASTNISFNVRRNDVCVLDVRIEHSVSVSNCVQIAFGRDADCNGELAHEETGLVLGWRSGRCFLEHVSEETRYIESVPMSAGNLFFLRMRVETDSTFSPRKVSFTNNMGSCFTEISETCPQWLFQRDWNLLKITRRGPVVSDEVCCVHNDYRSFWIILK